jgi:glycosyltransferase involved in cell wall biosynthesis
MLNMLTIYTFTHNSEYILPHFVKWYRFRFADCRIIVADDESNDNTKQVALTLGCEVIDHQISVQGKYSEASLLHSKNNIWKESLTDWVIVCDPDEFLDINSCDLNDNHTIIQGIGYDMVNVNNTPELCSIRHGVRAAQYDKVLCFNKRHISEINYMMGCHAASPIGNVIFSHKRPYMLHMRYVNVDALVDKYKLYSSRLSQADIDSGWSVHYHAGEAKFRQDFEDTKLLAQKLNLEKLEHYYTHIDGWFNMESQYLELLDATPENGLFVEIGAYKGRSTCFLATEIHNQKRNLNYVVVDSFEGAVNSPEPVEAEVYKNTTFTELYNEYLNNTAIINEYVTTEIGLSHEVADRFLDNSIDTLFIDGGHSYNQVKADIAAWLPKLKPTGIISGHDYQPGWPGVIAAVNEKFGKPHKVENTCWLVYLKQI